LDGGKEAERVWWIAWCWCCCGLGLSVFLWALSDLGWLDVRFYIVFVLGLRGRVISTSTPLVVLVFLVSCFRGQRTAVRCVLDVAPRAITPADHRSRRFLVPRFRRRQSITERNNLRKRLLAGPTPSENRIADCWVLKQRGNPNRRTAHGFGKSLGLASLHYWVDVSK
jgi:hypothetical protein